MTDGTFGAGVKADTTPPGIRYHVVKRYTMEARDSGKPQRAQRNYDDREKALSLAERWWDEDGVKAVWVFASKPDGSQETIMHQNLSGDDTITPTG